MTRYIAFLMLCFSLQAESQDLTRDYVKSNTIRLRAIDPDSTDYSDLEPIGRAIGDARVVMLGEQDHGDAPTFLAKTRLIKYLHEKKGFNVLAFEGDFFALNYHGAKSMAAVIRDHIYPVWTACKTCRPLFRGYLPAASQTANPLLLSGFDNQMNEAYLAPLLDSVIRQWQLPVAALPEYASELKPLLINWRQHVNDTAINNKYLALLATIKKQLREKLPADDFWCMIPDNLLTHNGYYTIPQKWSKRFLNRNPRDSQMAVNLRWLCTKKYPNEKIIVWAHNYHISKYAGHTHDNALNTGITMGTWFTRDPVMAGITYIVGFTSYEGTAGRATGFRSRIHKVRKPKANSFENWFDKAYEYAFTDFRGYNSMHPDSRESFNMSGSLKVYHTSFKAQWNRIFDGVVYIKKMYSCLELYKAGQ